MQAPRETTEGDRWVVGRKDDTPAREITGEGLRDVVKRVLVSPDDGWNGWVMRLFDVGPGGHTPRHAHPWPHINFVASGKGELYLDGDLYPLAPGSYACVPSEHEHQFRAAEGEPLSFICIVPADADY